MGFGRYGFAKADKKKKVVVVGGGPSGMEAARVAALRGHDVTLHREERRSSAAWCRWRPSSRAWSWKTCPACIDYLKTQVAKTGVKVELKQGGDVRVHRRR